MQKAQVPDIASRIAQARKAAGLTQQALADATGFSLRAVQTWEGGTRVPRMDALAALADALGRSVSFFFEASPGEVAA